MINLSYNISPSLRQELEKIEFTRNNILTKLVSPKEEIQLRWEAKISKISYASYLTEEPISKNDIQKIFASGKKDIYQQKLLSYSDSYNYIAQNWFLSKDKVTAEGVLAVYKNFKNTQKQIDEKELRAILEFIQVNPDHPIIQAGLAFILISEIMPENGKGFFLSLLLATIFLYKNGFDFRGMLNLEEYFVKDLKYSYELIKNARVHKNISEFLGYFISAVAIQSERALEKFAEKKIEGSIPEAFVTLTNRQREILALFDQPDIHITNKKIQQLFKVSQITASRDLVKLYSLGLIFSAGKGRSVYYTKI
jgi:predicted HTH transcriptional regulator